MAKRERKGGGGTNLPSHVTAAVPDIQIPETGHETRMPMKSAREALPVVHGKRIRCPRVGCGSIRSLVVNTSVYDKSVGARQVKRHCLGCLKDFLVDEA